jgi:putative transposase
MAFNIICGEPWTRTERSLIFWFSQRGIAGQRCASFASLLHVAKKPPRVIITDRLRSYAAAKKLIMPDIEHRQSRYLNNRAENSHQPTRVRERQMKRFKSSEQAQRFLSIFESLNAPFRLRRHLLSATRYRLLLNQSFHLWNKTALAALVA